MSDKAPNRPTRETPERALPAPPHAVTRGAKRDREGWHTCRMNGCPYGTPGKPVRYRGRPPCVRASEGDLGFWGLVGMWPVLLPAMLLILPLALPVAGMVGAVWLAVRVASAARNRRRSRERERRFADRACDEPRGEAGYWGDRHPALAEWLVRVACVIGASGTIALLGGLEFRIIRWMGGK